MSVAAASLEQVRFDPVEHRYFHGARELVSVSRVLDPITMLDGIPADILEAAADLGRKVHTACHYYDQGVLYIQDLDPILQPYLRAWIKFIVDMRVTVLASEVQVHHARLGFAGRLDKIALVPQLDSRKAIIDIKSCVAMPRTIGPQCSAYLEGELAGGNELGLSRRTARAGVLLKPDGTYRWHPLKATNHAADFNMFTSCLNIYRWRSRT